MNPLTSDAPVRCHQPNSGVPPAVTGRPTRRTRVTAAWPVSSAVQRIPVWMTFSGQWLQVQSGDCGVALRDRADALRALADFADGLRVPWWFKSLKPAEVTTGGSV